MYNIIPHYYPITSTPYSFLVLLLDSKSLHFLCASTDTNHDIYRRRNKLKPNNSTFYLFILDHVYH